MKRSNGMGLSKADRQWWASFAKWVTLILLLGTLLSPPFIVCLAWDRICQSVGSAREGVSRTSQWWTEILDWGSLGLLPGGVVVVIAAGFWLILSAPRRERRRASPPNGDAAFWRAAREATSRGFSRPAMSAEDAEATIGAASPYELLGVRRGATLDEIKSAYRRLIRVHHPDSGGDAETAKRIIAAYSVLIERSQPRRETGDARSGA